jgi:hypothetical protein
MREEVLIIFPFLLWDFPPLGDHDSCDCLSKEKGALQVYRNHVVPIRLREIFTGIAPNDPRVVKEKIDFPKFLQRSINQNLDVSHLRYVSSNGYYGASELTAFFRHNLQPLDIPACNDDFRPGLNETGGKTFPDSRSSARDDPALTLQAKFLQNHFLTPLDRRVFTKLRCSFQFSPLLRPKKSLFFPTVSALRVTDYPRFPHGSDGGQHSDAEILPHHPICCQGEKSGSRCLTISFPIGVKFEIFFQVVILSRFSDMIWIYEEQNGAPLELTCGPCGPTHKQG